jgi:RNA polymerase sigma factor (sigma-70 family)
VTTDVEVAVADAHRREWAFVLAATVRVAGDLDLAEECVQDAYARALTRWPTDGVPTTPGAWLTTVARRLAIDTLRRRSTFERFIPEIAEDLDARDTGASDREDIPDDRLRLIFTCCHPALATETQIALTLRLVCGLTTAEVSRALLTTEPTMAARITRAKKKIAGAGIPFRVPPVDDLPDRITTVLAVVHLVFTAGHTASHGDELMRRDLVERSLELARMLRTLLPNDAGVAGLLALIVLTDARRATRVDDAGELTRLADQDRGEWDHAEIAEGVGLVGEALRTRPPSRFALMAAIAAVHAESPSWDATDWREIVGLYDLLVIAWPSPVVALNRAVAIGFAAGPQAGLDAVSEIATEPALTSYSYLSSARAEFLSQLGRYNESVLAFDEALTFCDNAVERSFLLKRRTAVAELVAATD